LSVRGVLFGTFVVGLGVSITLAQTALALLALHPTGRPVTGPEISDPGRPWHRGRQAGPAPGHPAGEREALCAQVKRTEAYANDPLP
jgi:hypothetical protein